MSRKIKSASEYGCDHLRSIFSDMSGKDYSRAMKTDMELAIALLESAPDMYSALATFIGLVEAGETPEEPGLRDALKKANSAFDHIHTVFLRRKHES